MEDYLFSFLDYKILELNFNVKKKLKGGKEIAINPTLKIDKQIEENRLTVLFDINLSNDEMPFNIHLVSAGRFQFKKNPAEIKNIDEITNINCAGILFPFIRETIADITRRAGFAPLLLPPVNFCKIHDEITKQVTNDETSTS